jgi:hypothetical protein
VIVVVAAVLLSRRVWVSRQPGAFKGAIRVAEGRVPGLRPKWKRGFGRWAGEVLVWSKAPMLFRNELTARAPALGAPLMPDLVAGTAGPAPGQSRGFKNRGGRR